MKSLRVVAAWISCWAVDASLSLSRTSLTSLYCAAAVEWRSSSRFCWKLCLIAPKVDSKGSHCTRRKMRIDTNRTKFPFLSLKVLRTSLQNSSQSVYRFATHFKILSDFEIPSFSRRFTNVSRTSKYSDSWMTMFANFPKNVVNLSATSNTRRAPPTAKEDSSGLLWIAMLTLRMSSSRISRDLATAGGNREANLYFLSICLTLAMRPSGVRSLYAARKAALSSCFNLFRYLFIAIWKALPPLGLVRTSDQFYRSLRNLPSMLQHSPNCFCLLLRKSSSVCRELSPATYARATGSASTFWERCWSDPTTIIISPRWGHHHRHWKENI